MQPSARRSDFFAKAFVTLAGVAAIAGCAASHDSLTPPVRTAENISRALPAVSPTPAAEQVNCTGAVGLVGCAVKKNPNIPISLLPTGGLRPAQLRSAYGLSPNGSAANGRLVAIVTAFDDRSAESDLALYRLQFGLPPCLSLTGCFRKVVMDGAKLPPGQAKKIDGGAAAASTWADETALDLAMASASCPSCKLLLVEAGGQDLDSLAAAVNLAATYAPAAISTSWGVAEAAGGTGIDAGAQAAFNHPGIAITAAAGDTGDVQFPASSPYVTAVGGTTLAADGSARGWNETVWSQTGNGCSTMFAAPAWQSGPNGCSGRFVADVSMIADYNPGVTVYSSAEGGWVVLGGTSVGAPFVAGLYAQAGDYGAATTGAPSLYANLAQLNPVSGMAGETNGSPSGLTGF